MTDHTPPTGQQLDEIEARTNAATPGPWQGRAELASHIVCTAPKDGTYSVLWNAEWATEADAAFTAHAREDVRVLLAEVRRLRVNPPMVCINCETPVGWIDCPTGGWWAHETHPVDGHDAAPKPAPAVVVGGVSGTNQ